MFLREGLGEDVVQAGLDFVLHRRNSSIGGVSRGRAPALKASNPQARKQFKPMSRIDALHVSPRRRMVHLIRRYGLLHRHDWSRFWATIWHRQRPGLIPCLRVTISLSWRRVRDQRLTPTPMISGGQAQRRPELCLSRGRWQSTSRDSADTSNESCVKYGAP